MIVYSKVTTAPTTEPVDLALARKQVRVTSGDDDTYLTTLIKVARQLCEKYAGMSFITQTRQIKLDRFPLCDADILLPYGPVSAVGVGNFTYTNSTGGTTTLVAGTDYTLDTHSEIARLVTIDGWPTDVSEDVPNAISITYAAGYASAADVPEVIKLAICQQIAKMDSHRGDDGTGGLSEGAMDLLDTVKVYHNARQD